MKPRRFGLNLPGRDFRFELEDLVPALAGTIGIIAMYSAVMMSWADGLTQAWDHVNLGKDFAIEVARSRDAYSCTAVLYSCLWFL